MSPDLNPATARRRHSGINLHSRGRHVVDLCLCQAHKVRVADFGEPRRYILQWNNTSAGRVFISQWLRGIIREFDRVESTIARKITHFDFHVPDDCFEIRSRRWNLYHNRIARKNVRRSTWQECAPDLITPVPGCFPRVVKYC